MVTCNLTTPAWLILCLQRCNMQCSVFRFTKYNDMIHCINLMFGLIDLTQRKLFIFLSHDDIDSTLDMTTRGRTADMFRVTCSMLLAARHLLTFSRNLEVASSSSAESSAPAPPPPSSLWPVSGIVASLITLVPGAVFSVAALIITSSLSSLSSPPRHDLIIFIISSPYSAVRPLEFLWNKFWSRLSLVWNVSVSGYTAAAILTGLLLM